MNTRDWNETLRSLNVGLPDDVERLKAAGYYEEAIARIDAYLAEDWTMTQNSPYSQGLCHHMDVQPENPTPHGMDVLRDAMIAQREIMRRIPAEYTWSKADAIAEMQRRVKDFTPEEFEMLDRENRMDWRFVEGEKRYQNRFASTLIATHADLARRQIDPPAQPDSEKERCRRLHEKMAEQGSASARITLKASVGMSDEAFATALAKAKAEGRDAVHVRAWLPLPAACLSQSDIELEEFTEEPTVIAPENAPQRTVCWEADLTENRSFGVQYSYRNTAVYTDPFDTPSAPEQPDFDTEEQPSHIVFTPYIKALAAQLTAGITDPMEKAKRIYDYVTLNVRYHYQPSYFIHESLRNTAPGTAGATAASCRSRSSPSAARQASRPAGRAASMLPPMKWAATTGPCSTWPPRAGCMRIALSVPPWPAGATKRSASTILAIWTPTAWWPTACLQRRSHRPCWASGLTPVITRPVRWKRTA